MSLRIAVRIFDDREQQHLSSILALARQRGSTSLAMTAAADANVLIIRKDDPGASAFLQPQRKSALPVAVLYDNDTTAHDWVIRKPATTAELIPLLEKIAGHLAAVPANPHDTLSTAPALATKTAGLLPTRIGQALLERLLPSAEAGQNWLLPLGKNESLIIHHQSKRVYFPAAYRQNMKDLLTLAMQGDFHLLPPEWRAPQLAGNPGLAALPHEQFAWAACHACEPVLPLPPTLLETAFRLQRWPGFTRLEHSMLHLQWSSTLVKGATTFTQLLSRGGSPRDIARFYNACLVAGLVMAGSSHAATPATTADSQEKAGIFQRIMQRLRA